MTADTKTDYDRQQLPNMMIFSRYPSVGFVS